MTPELPMSTEAKVSEMLNETIGSWLVNDLNNMVEKARDVRDQNPGGAGQLGYPLVLVCFSALELFGVLTHKEPFSPDRPSLYFQHLWKHYFADRIGCSKNGDLGKYLYGLFRNPIAHSTWAGINTEVVFDSVTSPLSYRKTDEHIVIDAAKLAEATLASYREVILELAKKPMTAPPPNSETIWFRLQELLTQSSVLGAYHGIIQQIREQLPREPVIPAYEIEQPTEVGPAPRGSGPMAGSSVAPKSVTGSINIPSRSPNF